MVRIRACQLYFTFCCCFLFAFRSFYFDLFSVLSLTASTICQLLHLGIKSQKAVDSLYCVQKFSIFLFPNSSCLHNRAIVYPTNEVFYAEKNVYRVYIYITFLITFFSNASDCYIYRTQKKTAEMSIAIQACTIRIFGNPTVSLCTCFEQKRYII